MGESTVWKRVKEDPNFPRPISLSANMTVFNIQEVNEYMALQARTVEE
jgi:predicted DNA-binding transcriptional regulator AlpA